MSSRPQLAKAERESQDVAREYSWQMFLILRDMLPLLEDSLEDRHLLFAAKIVVGKITDGEHVE